MSADGRLAERCWKPVLLSCLRGTLPQSTLRLEPRTQSQPSAKCSCDAAPQLLQVGGIPPAWQLFRWIANPLLDSGAEDQRESRRHSGSAISDLSPMLYRESAVAASAVAH